MNKLMDINEACETIELFAEVNHLDPLSGIEVMVKYFKQLSQLGDLYVGVHSDQDMLSYKRKPIICYNERLFCVKSCRYVTDIIENTKLDFTIGLISVRFI